MSHILEAIEAKRPAAQVKEIIQQHKHEVNVTNSAGWTPLRLIVSKWDNHEEANELVRCLLKAGADQTIPAEKGHLCPIHEVLRGPKKRDDKQLLKHAAQTLIEDLTSETANITTSYGLTPLHYVAQSGDIELAQMLIRAGSNPTALTNDGNTPAHYAGAVGDRDMMNFFIDMGCDHNQESENGWTCFGKLFEKRLPSLAAKIDLNAHPTEQMIAVNPDANMTLDDAQELLDEMTETRPSEWDERVHLWREVRAYAKNGRSRRRDRLI